MNPLQHAVTGHGDLRAMLRLIHTTPPKVPRETADLHDVTTTMTTTILAQDGMTTIGEATNQMGLTRGAASVATTMMTTTMTAILLRADETTGTALIAAVAIYDPQSDTMGTTQTIEMTEDIGTGGEGAIDMQKIGIAEIGMTGILETLETATTGI
jgi:hypothetical protein